MKTIYAIGLIAVIALSGCDFGDSGRGSLSANSGEENADGGGISSIFSKKKSLADIELEVVKDPVENAFKISLPKGWRNEPRLVRVGTEARKCMTSTSPDGKIQIVSGDANLPVFNKPIPELGLYEGMNMGDPRFQIRNYVRADKFLSDYVTEKFGRNEGFRIVSVTPDEKFDRESKAELVKMGLQNQVTNTSAVVTFEYKQNGEAFTGRLNGYTSEMSSAWFSALGYFSGPAEQFLEIDALVEKIRTTYSENPQWNERESAAIAQRGQMQRAQSQAQMNQMNAAHNQRMANMQNNWNAHQQNMSNLQQTYDQNYQSWQNQQNYQDNQHNRTIDAIREEQLIRGDNGQYGKAEYGYDNYYVNPNTNQYFGTNSELQTIPDGYEQWQPTDYNDDW